MDKDKLIADLREALGLALGWIDAVPKDTPLPAMPGFDRDWVETVLAAQPDPAEPGSFEADVAS